MAYVTARPDYDQAQIGQSGFGAPSLGFAQAQPDDGSQMMTGPMFAPVPQDMPEGTADVSVLPDTEQPDFSVEGSGDQMPDFGSLQDAIAAAQGRLSNIDQRTAADRDAYQNFLNQRNQLALGPATVAPISQQERMIAGALGLLGILGGARNASQATQAYLGNRQNMVNQDYARRQQMFNAQRQDFDDMAKMQYNLLGLDRYDQQSAQGALTKAQSTLATAQTKASQLEETRRKNQAMEAIQKGKLDETVRYNKVKADQAEKKQAEWLKLQQDLESGRMSRNADSIAARLQAAGWANDRAIKVANILAGSRENVAAYNGWFKQQSTNLRAAQGAWSNAFREFNDAQAEVSALQKQYSKSDKPGDFIYDPLARAAVDRLTAAQKRLQEAQGNIDAISDGLDDAPDIQLPKAQAPGAGQSSPFPPPRPGSSPLPQGFQPSRSGQSLQRSSTAGPGSASSVGQAYEGKMRYSFGGTSPTASDCSAFVQRAFKEDLGVNIPRSTTEQFAASVKVPTPKINDLVGFGPGSGPHHANHVGIVVGFAPDGVPLVRHNSTPGGVTTQRLDQMSAYRSGRFKGYYRPKAMADKA